MKTAYALPRGPLPPVVIREPESGKYQPLPEVPVKGKAKVTEEEVAHDLLNRKHMDLDVADISPQPSMEKLDEGFTATVYPKVQENLKLAVEEQVLLEEPASSSGTLSSLQHLTGPFEHSGAPGASGSSQVPPLPPPPPSSTRQESPSKGSAAPSPSMTTASAEYQAWTTTD
nr:hypothetical protein [Tanacetum cinerariifolium]